MTCLDDREFVALLRLWMAHGDEFEDCLVTRLSLEASKREYPTLVAAWQDRNLRAGGQS